MFDRFRRWFDHYFLDGVYVVAYRYSDKYLWTEKKARFNVVRQRGRYWYADPIPAVIQGKTYIFMEQYDRVRGKGAIAVSELNEKGGFSKPATILSDETHYSFPAIVVIGNDYYMIPEAAERKQIRIYKMGKDAHIWNLYYCIELGHRIVDLIYKIDGDTLILQGGMYEKDMPLFTCREIVKIEHFSDISKLKWEVTYTAEDKDLYTRNAGMLYQDKDRILRLGQESTPYMYGRNLLVNDVEAFTESGIEETEIAEVLPNQIETALPHLFYRLKGIHTYGRLQNGLEVIDLNYSVKIPTLYPIRRRRYLNKQK